MYLEIKDVKKSYGKDAGYVQVAQRCFHRC